MKLLFYDTKPYDRLSFEKEAAAFPDLELDFVSADLEPNTAALAEGYDGVCAFVSSKVNAHTLTLLCEKGVRLVLMRCAGYNNVNLDIAHRLGIRIMHVPGYSPEAVAEHAIALALACNRRLYKAYNKVRENDFSLSGLMGFNFYGKTAGIIGTGKIGAAMCRICLGFGMKVLACDVYENPALKGSVTYVKLERLLQESHLVSLHCPLNDATRHLINRDTIAHMREGVILVNTSRGGLVKTEDLIEGIRLRKFAGVGLDVYEEETDNVFEDRSEEILEHSTTARLLSFPNVMITSHQGFFTGEALSAIAHTTLENAMTHLAGSSSPNEL